MAGPFPDVMLQAKLGELTMNRQYLEHMNVVMVVMAGLPIAQPRKTLVGTFVDQFAVTALFLYDTCTCFLLELCSKGEYNQLK